MTMIDVNSVKDKVNDYFFTQLDQRLSFLPDDMQEEYVSDAIAMTNVGVRSTEEQKVFYYIVTHVPQIAKELLVNPSPDVMAKISAIVFQNRNEMPINNIYKFFLAVAEAAKSLGLNIVKKAYPQGTTANPLYPVYDIRRWMSATRGIYSRVRAGEDFNEAFAQITRDWNTMDKIDFKHWLRFYQEGADKKYKFAQQQQQSVPPDYYFSDNGFFVPNKVDPQQLKGQLPGREVFQSGHDARRQQHAFDPDEARQKIEMQRAKIIGRLNAAEKLLCSIEGQMFAGDNQAEMLQLLHALKMRVQTANKLSTRSSLFIDYIYRVANMLADTNRQKPAAFFYKVAQSVEDPTAALLGEESGATETKSDDAQPDALEMLENEPELGGGNMTQPPVDSGASEQTRQAFKEFFSRLETGLGFIDEDDEDDEDESKVAAVNYDLIVEGQELQPPQMNETIEVSEDEIPQGEPADAPDVFEQALANITVKDVVDRLEVLSGLFKKREIAKELYVIDMMMDKLGLSVYFPGLGEATKSALESNGYVSTRIDDILSKLRGSLMSEEVDGMIEGFEEPAETTPEVEMVKQKLDNAEERDKERKDRRRVKEDQKLMGGGDDEKPKPATTELQGPATVERSRPIPEIR